MVSQIAVSDIVSSLDSVIAVIGMAEELWVLVTAVMIPMGFSVLVEALNLIARRRKSANPVKLRHDI